MKSKYLAAALLGTALLSGGAFAQNTNTDRSNINTAAAHQEGQWRSSKLIGVNVYNDNNDKIGEIEELIVDKSGKVDNVVIGVGGFLGMGEHYVAVSPSSVSIRHDAKNDKWVASMNTTKEALKAAPEFKYPK
jgi:sporulation protein YlmC with PRC-barrel domain